MAPEVIRVVVADDHPVFRRGLVATLADIEGVEVVAAVADGAAAIEAARTLSPDVVLMDLSMPGVDGRTATRTITQELPAVAVLVLTMSDDPDSVGAALRAGARGYLLKGAEEAAIARALQAVAAGDVVLSRVPATTVLDAVTGRRAVPESFPELSPRERQILDLVARGLGNVAVARELHLSDKTVRNQLSTILVKIGVPDRATAIERARQAGLGGARGGSP